MHNLDSLLTNSKHGSGLAFYNTSKFTLKKLLEDPKNLRSNFKNYLNGFSENVQDIINKFKFRNEIETLDEAQILFSLIEKFCSPKIELHPNKLPPLAMGYVYEDLVRRFNEENNEEAGEHFTPREIIDLMTHLVFLPVKDKIQKGTYLVYDPCVGSGGMLTIAKNFMLNPEGPVKSHAAIHLYGQESNSRVNDGQLMFVLHMLSKMKNTELGSRIASVHNGSALFTGDAGGESEIRKHIIENDLLEAIVALPNDMFYNTGIPTYIFIMTNRKAEHRKGKVQLINATSETFYHKMRKSLGKKRVEYKAGNIAQIEKLFMDFEENEFSKIFDNADFGYAQITVNRPLKDESGKTVFAGKGKPKPDSKLKDIENIPLKEDIQAFFEREVLPFAPDAWWEKKDTKIGYEINFNKYFYKYQAPRNLKEIAADILAIEEETGGLLKEIVNG